MLWDQKGWLKFLKGLIKMKNLTKSEISFRKQMLVASFLFAFFFIALLSVGGYIISKDLGEKEIFKTLDHYRNELQKMTTSISETEIAKGFKYQKSLPQGSTNL